MENRMGLQLKDQAAMMIHGLPSRINGLARLRMQALQPLKLVSLKSLYGVLEIMTRSRGLRTDQANLARTTPGVIAAGDRPAGTAMQLLKRGWIDTSRKLREVGTMLREGGRQVQGHTSGELKIQICLTTFARSKKGA